MALPGVQFLLANPYCRAYYPAAHDHLNFESGPRPGPLFLFWVRA